MTAVIDQLQHHPRRAIVFILISLFILGSTDVLVKLLSEEFDAPQIGFVRFLVTLLLVLVLTLRSPVGLSILRTRRPVEHFIRATFAMVELILFYTAISYIPLPTAMSIVSAAPIFATLLGVVFLRERLGIGAWLAVIAGFVGMLLVVQPEDGADNMIGTSAALGSIVLWSTAQLLGRRLTTTESSETILFYYAFIGVIGLAFAMPFFWETPDWQEMGLLISVGVLGCIGQYFLILAFRYGPLSLLAPFEYSGLIWACLYGWLIWGDVLSPLAVLGVVVIVASCIYISRRVQH